MVNHLENGSIKLDGKQYPINWTGEIAQHVTENYINNTGGVHTVLHLEIQKNLQKAKEIRKVKKNIYVAYNEVSDGLIIVIFEKSSKFVSIKTGYKIKSIIEKQLQYE